MRLPALALLLATAPMLRGEEGMWTFDNLPLKAMQAAHRFEPSPAWLDHLRLASLRFPGGSGSFVSADGLVLTNHHVVRGYLQSLSTRERDLLKDGFVAQSLDQELKVPGLELVQLVETRDITARLAAVAGATEAERLRARERESQQARQDLEAKTGLRVQVVTLYQGGQTWLYGYRVFKDIRLVMSPELSVARFGGDHDNFTYPRHHLDFSLLRAYEDGKPVRPAHHLRWSRTGLKAGDLTVVSGHPGTTNRLWTLDQMRDMRDQGLPRQIEANQWLRDTLEAYARRGFDARVQVGGRIYGLDNALKSQRGQLAGLKDPEGMARVEAAEADLRSRVQADPAQRAEAGGSWAALAQALARGRALAAERQLFQLRDFPLLAAALDLARLPEELGKPAGARLPEYTDGGLKELRARLLRPRTLPHSAELETYLLAAWMGRAQAQLGPGHPVVGAALQGRTPAEAADAAVRGSRLGDPDELKRLLDGGAAAVAASADPMLQLARRLDPLQRALRRRLEEEVDGPVKEHAARLARARFALYGTSTYPDATFTLRLSYGTVAGYPANGTLIQPFTTMHGLVDRFLGWGGTGDNLSRDTWRLPQRWLDRLGSLNLATPYNFASTNDIIGGNSGSPVVDRQGDLVGLAFDGNLESLPGAFYFDPRANRTVSVDARAILEVLAKVYDAPRLVAELTRP